MADVNEIDEIDEISNCYRNIESITKTLDQQIVQFHNDKPSNRELHKYHADIGRYESEFCKVRDRNRKKFDKLNQKVHPPVQTPDTWCVNLTNTAIPQDVRNLIALGPKHGIPNDRTNLPINDMIASVELALTGYLPKTKDNIRSEIVSTISNYTKKTSTE